MRQFEASRFSYNSRCWLQAANICTFCSGTSWQVDVWACGILAYELMVGHPPFEVKDESETRKKIMYETTLTFPSHVSSEAIDFIKRALAKQAGLRPEASDMIHHPWIRPHLSTFAAQPGADVASLK
jgi:aurora kinase